MQKSLLEASAKTASEFILILAGVFLAAALVWIIFFSKSFTKPSVEMNAVTKDMAALDFRRKLTHRSSDEIGQLADSINDLSTKLDGALTDLRDKNAKLQDEIDAERRLDSMRRGFVSNVSHELKTPISIIQGYAEGLKLGISEDKEKREEYCDVILEESIRMNHLVLDLLELSRYESGQIKIQREDFDMAALIRDICQKLSGRFAEKEAGLELELPGTLFVNADPLRMEQVLSNYLNNAASHVTAGGTIRVTAEARDNLARISVYNTGKPISADDMPQIGRASTGATSPTSGRKAGLGWACPSSGPLWSSTAGSAASTTPATASASGSPPTRPPPLRRKRPRRRIGRRKGLFVHIKHTRLVHGAFPVNQARSFSECSSYGSGTSVNSKI